jgi:hypothetical protein
VFKLKTIYKKKIDKTLLALKKYVHYVIDFIQKQSVKKSVEPLEERLIRVGTGRLR